MRLHKDYVKPAERMNVSKTEMNFLLSKYILDTEFHIKTLQTKISKREYEIASIEESIKKTEKSIKTFQRKVML